MPDSTATASWSTIAPIAFGSSVFGTLAGKLLDRGGARAETIREEYADAVKALNARGPFGSIAGSTTGLRRSSGWKRSARTSSSPWLTQPAGERREQELGRVCNAVVQLLRAEATISAPLAWASASITTGIGMNIGVSDIQSEAPEPEPGQIPAEWMILQEFSGLTQYRIGW